MHLLGHGATLRAGCVYSGGDAEDADRHARSAGGGVVDRRTARDAIRPCTEVSDGQRWVRPRRTPTTAAALRTNATLAAAAAAVVAPTTTATATDRDGSPIAACAERPGRSVPDRSRTARTASRCRATTTTTTRGTRTTARMSTIASGSARSVGSGATATASYGEPVRQSVRVPSDVRGATSTATGSVAGPGRADIPTITAAVPPARTRCTRRR